MQLLYLTFIFSKGGGDGGSAASWLGGGIKNKVKLFIACCWNFGGIADKYTICTANSYFWYWYQVGAGIAVIHVAKSGGKWL